METAPISYRREYCPYCACKTKQKITTLLDYPDNKPTGYEARECLKCFRTTVWLRGFMVYPPDKFLINMTA